MRRLDLTPVAAALAREARRAAPEDSGRLRKSIEAGVERDRVTAGSGLPYAQYVDVPDLDEAALQRIDEAALQRIDEAVFAALDRAEQS